MRRAISWTILSSVQLIPRGRVVPSSLGISTRRTGWGRYDIWDSFVCSACKWVSRCCAYISFVTPSTPGAFVPSSAAKHARRLSTVKWCINAVKGAVGWLRARWAIRSTPVVVVAPPLRVADVAIERATGCAPLCSAGVTPLRRSYEGIRLPLYASPPALPMTTQHSVPGAWPGLPGSGPTPDWQSRALLGALIIEYLAGLGEQRLHMFPDPLGAIADDAQPHRLLRNQVRVF